MKYIILLFAVVFINAAQAQVGFYGKRIFIDASGTGSIPILSSKSDVTYFKKDGELINRSDRFDYGFRLTTGYAIRHFLCLSFEFSYERSNMAAPNFPDLYDPLTGIYAAIEMKHERFDLRSFVFMPKIEFTGKHGMLPVGLSHQIGIGLSTSKILEKEYQYSTPNTPNFDYTAFYNHNNKSVKGLALAYSLTVRTPISKSILINYGIRYNLNYVPLTLFGNDLDNDEDYYLNKNEIVENIRARRIRSILSLNMGLSLAL